jgi:hypothetical protein
MRTIYASVVCIVIMPLVKSSPVGVESSPVIRLRVLLETTAAPVLQ